MSELTSRILSSNEPAFAPLRRADLPSFLVSLPDGLVLAATPPCAALGIRENGPAPVGPKAVARRVAAGGRAAMRLERVRLPATFIPRIFACRAIQSPLGRVVLFADPRAVEPDAHASALSMSAVPVSGASAPTPAAQKPLRFSFETDDAGRLTFLSQSFWDALSLPDAPTDLRWSGRSFADLAQAGVFRNAASLIAALHTGDSFSDVAVWTGEAPPRRVDVGGVPIATPMGGRRGMRGFGLLWPAAEGVADTLAIIAPAAALPHAPSGAENVVPLRGGNLTARERTAFHEIARTLSSAIESWPRGTAVAPQEDAGPQGDLDPPPSQGAEPEPSNFQSISDIGDDAGLLDRLPLGIVVEQQGAIVRVNQTLLGWIGVPDRDAFVRAGGLNGHLARERVDGGLMLVPLQGPQLPVELRLVSAQWLGRAALVHVLRCLDPEEFAQPPVLPAASLPAPMSDLALALAPVNLAMEREIARTQALDLIPLPVFLLDEAGAIRDANAAAVELSGFSRAELQSEPFTLLFTAQSQRAAVALLDAAEGASSSAPAGSVPLKVRQRIGGDCEMEAVIALASEAPPRFCLLLRPPSSAEMAFRVPPVLPMPRAELEAEPSAELAGFTRRVSLAVRDPLTGILGFIDAVRSASFGPLGNSRYAKQADAALLQGQRLMSALEDIEQLVPAKTSFLTDVVNLTDIVTEAIAHLAGVARRRRVLVRCELTPQLEISTCAPAIARIVRLLLEEALRATPAGGQVFVSTRLESGEDGPACAILKIRDGGAGLSEEEIGQALDFHRPAPTTDRFSAAGLPFRLARLAALARAQHGVLQLRRGVEAGMLSELRLPL
ncbi:MAG: hypothetical protein B7Z15_08685 [Rhizobiales bacterium 32-66-8]|nr:MAG: hypothetical protein B7Z15_08685 [Rhizobiales bacterium 32-66-8]